MAGIVQSLNAEWAHVARSPLARRALMRWATANPVLAEARSVDDFVDTRSCPAWGEAVHRVLAAEAPDDSMAARTLLQTLLGGIVCLCRRVGKGEPDAIDELVALAWARIRTYPSHRQGSVASNVLLDVRKQYLRDRHGAGRGTHTVMTVELPPDRAADEPTPEQVVCDRVVVDALLSARDQGMVSDSALAAIIRTRVGGESLVDVAAEMNLSPDAMWRRRTRAEHRLRTLPLAS
jgi:DNA-directed RNA polymerase specialized sigma24 family protein